ncbi:uncharacterized protein LOC116344287 [Contarinia nasturtii]|uniref:uncharacterized protein LOC116344287 n=1 Tax=Contarinia nasturtii TaxID=265458 RepID=UPI0012D3BF06|nr:uncharacterized protein LOC116344287 [Contarinia nasturtii]
MKAIIIICVSVALLPSIIHSGSSSDTYSGIYNYVGSSSSSSIGDPDKELNEAHDRLEVLLKNDGNINNVFKPTKFLGKGGFSVTYLGKMLRTDKVVAMKFSPTFKEDIENEYAMYTYLGAINNSTVENYGIPTVYYYGKWEDCSMIAITPLDPQFNQIEENPEKRSSLTDVDIFIICREYVRISKFIHSRGVCHCDSHLGNIMFRGNKGFIIDFNSATELTADSEDCRISDWRFLLNLCDLAGIEVDWMNSHRMNAFLKIPNLQRKGLKKVLLEFVRSIYRPPAGQLDYHRMFDIISAEIQNKGVREPAILSWLTTEEQKRQAIAEWRRLPTSDIRFIKSIANPYTAQFSYPPANYSYFASL